MNDRGVLGGMPRQPRGVVVEGIYHVTARGNDRRPIFLDDYDRNAYLALLGEVCERCEWRRLAYCLMNNHVHLLVEITRPNLSDGMHRLQFQHARKFNHRHQRTGHLFEDRFWSVRVASDEQLVAVTRYIAMNPVEAGLCSSPELWEWTDCAAAQSRCQAMYGPSTRSA
jgi:putative transposase